MSEYEKEYQVQIKNEGLEQEDFPKNVVIIPIVNSPIFPGMIAPIILTEDRFTIELDKDILKTGYVALNLVKPNDQSVEEEEDEDDDGQPVDPRDIYKVGVLCKVVKKLKLPDGSVNILVHGMRRYRTSTIMERGDLLEAEVEVFDDIIETDEELDAYTRSVINQVKKLSEINPYFNEEMKLAMLNSPSPGALADLVAFALSLDIPEAQDFIETLLVKKRFAKLLVYLKREKDVADIQKKISDEVNDKVNKYQREYFLREQLKVIRSELGMDEDEKSKDISRMRDQLSEIDMSEEALKAVKEELDRLEVIPDSSPEYNVSRTYINWMLETPWNVEEEKDIEIEKAAQMLEKDHYGLEKVKERVLEFLAVRKLKPAYDGTILCFSGPPGVGKTSMGRSIANALGRKFYRFSLGGMKDEAEIKGHRRTYIGAMPGKIIQALKRVSVSNPVIMLDEIDKLGKSYQGDPASALLEVLDPEQNSTFIDNYLDVPIDLSKVLFIATANYVNDIPEPLLDRMEVIDISGYTLEEKISISKKWIIPKQLKKHGLKKVDLNLSSTVLKKLIHDYAREPGVRMMEQFIAKLCRKAALEKITKGKRKRNFTFKPLEKNLEPILGPARFQSDLKEKNVNAGVVTGLAWTSFGGEILFIETLPLKGKGGFKLTGQLGDVMNESANIAYSYVKKLLQEDEIIDSKKVVRKKVVKKVVKKDDEEKEDFLDQNEVHLHLPAGATPKDGPSAGITMALALYSLAKGKKINPSIAMTGELSLTGKVLPVGGIKEKVLAAKRAGIKQIILPKSNEKDLAEVPERHRKGLKFFPVSHFSEVLGIAVKK
jgi:ATP-dependent Lon protease